MRTRFILNSVAVAALVVTLATSANAQTPGGRGRGGPGNGPGVAGPGPVPGSPAVAGGQRRGGGPGRMGPGGPNGAGQGGRGGRVAAALGLSDEQKVAVEKLRVNTRDDVAPLVDQLRLAQRNLRRAVFADTVDASATAKVAAEVKALRQQIADKGLDARKALAAVLTEEQRTKLRQARAGAGRRLTARRGAMGRGVGPNAAPGMVPHDGPNVRSGGGPRVGPAGGPMWRLLRRGLGA